MLERIADPGEEIYPVGLRLPVGEHLENWRRPAPASPAARRSTSPHFQASMHPRCTASTVLIVSPSKMPSISLPPLVMRKIFGSGQAGFVGLEPLDRAAAEDQHAMRRLAAQRLLPGEGDDIELGPNRGSARTPPSRVADRQPPRSALIQSPFGTRTPEVVPFQVKTTSLSKFTCFRSADNHSRR